MRNISYDKQVSLYSDQSIKTSRTTEIGGWVRLFIYPPGIPFISIKASLATCPCQPFLTDLQIGEKNGSDIPMTAAALTLALQQCVNYDHLIWFNSSGISFYKHKVDRRRNGSKRVGIK